MKKITLVLSCEHAVNTVPEKYQSLFAPYKALLQTHRGIDFGALTVTQYLSQHFSCNFIQARTTRLLIDYNRSLYHRQCFSEITRPLPQIEKNQLIEKYYLPYRQEVEKRIKEEIKDGSQVLHLSVHSFTPIFNEVIRNADLGLLYDPRRASERLLAKLWQQELRKLNSALRVRKNYPYRGINDGFSTALRKLFADKDYIGLELELNQALVDNAQALSSVSELLAVSLKSLMARV